MVSEDGGRQLKLNEVSLVVEEVTSDGSIEWRVVVERANGEGGTVIGNRRQGLGMEDVKWKTLNEDLLMKNVD